MFIPFCCAANVACERCALVAGWWWLKWWQAPSAASLTSYNMLMATRGTTKYFGVRGDGLVSSFLNTVIGDAATDVIIVNSTISGGSPLVLEGA